MLFCIMGGVCCVCAKQCNDKSACVCDNSECDNRAHLYCLKLDSLLGDRWFCEKCRPIPVPAIVPAPEEEEADAEAADAEATDAEDEVDDGTCLVYLGQALESLYECTRQLVTVGFSRNDSLKDVTMSACLESMDKYTQVVDLYRSLTNNATALKNTLDQLEKENHDLKIEVAHLDDACKKLQESQTIVCFGGNDCPMHNQPKRKKN